MTFGDSAAYWAPEPLPVCDSCGPDMVLIVTGQNRQKTGYIPTHAPAIAPGEHERVTRCRPREWHKRQERPALVAPHSSNACARNLRLSLRLRHCSRAARRRRSISRASKASAHCAYAAGTWQSMAAHRLWWLVCHRQCCQSLTCVLEPQQAAAASSSSSLLLPHKSSQRRSEACRNRVVLSLLRLSAFKPIDRSWMVARVSLRLVQFHSDTLKLKTSPTELRVAPSALPRAPCGHGRCS